MFLKYNFPSKKLNQSADYLFIIELKVLHSTNYTISNEFKKYKIE